MSESILDSVKKALGVGADYDVFDPDIIMHINSALFTLQQVGIGDVNGFQITGDGETWDDFTDSDPLLNAVKSYLYIRVRLLFDPPQTSFLIAALEKQAEEYIWRLSVHRETLVGATQLHNPAVLDGGDA